MVKLHECYAKMDYPLVGITRLNVQQSAVEVKLLLAMYDDDVMCRIFTNSFLN